MLSDQTLIRLTRSPGFVALTGDLIRALTATAASLLIVWYWVYYKFLATQMFSSLHMNDFGKFYYSTKAFIDGEDMYGPNVATAFRITGGAVRQFWNMNPPHFHLLVLPLAWLKPLPALLLWSLASLLALIQSLRIIARELRIDWTPMRLAWTAAAVVLCSATGIVIVTGQLSFLIMLAMTMAWSSARRGKWTAAAVALGIAVSIKPFLGIFWIYLLLTRRFKAAAVMTATAAACAAVGLAVFGWAPYAGWLRVLGQVDWTFVPMNASIQGTLARTLSGGRMFVPLIEAPAVVTPLAALLSGLVGVSALVLCTRDRSAEAIDRAFAGLLLTALLVSPLGWMYYIWLAAGPLAVLWLRWAARPSRLRDACLVVAVPGLLLPVYMTLAASNVPVGSITLGSAYGWTMLALWGAVMSDGWKYSHRRTHDAHA